MNDNILKIKDKAIYTLEEKVNTSDYLLCLKYFPKVYWLKILINSIFLILVSILLGTYYHSLFDFLISLVILEIINLISLTINYDKVMTKRFRKYNEEGMISNRYDFYIDYLILLIQLLYQSHLRRFHNRLQFHKHAPNRNMKMEYVPFLQ